MKKELKNKIAELKSNSFNEIDHLSILQEICDEFNEGRQEYYLLARYFINGLDDTPNLKQRELWNESAFEKAREIFYNSHDQLIQIIETYYDLKTDETLQQQFHANKNLKSIWIEKNGRKQGIFKRYYDDTKIAIISEYDNGKRTGSVKEWYPNGQMSEIGKYSNNEYVVEQFWDENGKQLLKDGTGKTIRKYGTNDYDIYEQYFENYEFKGEQKIQGVTFGKFEEKKNET